jgi:GTP diphosphokinase / guanosine-3',5'-bis(diphosphate) 3'-diphosphatase
MPTTENNELIILRAIDFAARKHRDQRRKDQEASPYINHPISVSLLIAKIGGIADAEVLAAAILHDTLEDTKTTPEELAEAFGTRVRKLVEEVTDDKDLPKAKRKELQIAHAAQLSPDAVLIKLGDKISNVLDVSHSPPAEWNLQRRREYLDWAEVDDLRRSTEQQRPIVEVHVFTQDDKIFYPAALPNLRISLR